MKNALVLLLGLAVLAGLFVWMKPAPPPAPAVAAATPAAASAESTDAVAVPQPAAPAAPVPQVFELVVKEKRLASGPQVITVTEGTSVILRITTDHHDELHLHGYDLTLKLPTASTAELSFVADRSGRFEYEMHHSHFTLGVLEVQPR